jgi:hypothetical protein
MKKLIVFVMLAVFLMSVMSSTVSAALLTSWIPTARTIPSGGSGGITEQQIIDDVAQLNADSLTFEGLLQAYSVNQNSKLEEQLTLASKDLIASAEALDAELSEIYQNLKLDQKTAFLETYNLIDSYFEELDDNVDQLSKSVEGLGNLLDGIDLGGTFGGLDL